MATVFALDVTCQVVSLARVQSTEDGSPAKVTRGWVEPEPIHPNPRPAYLVERRGRTADEVISKLTSDGNPDLVVFAKQLWGHMTGLRDRGRVVAPADPSADHRLYLHGLIEAKLVHRGVPLAEIPYSTALKWATGKGNNSATQIMTGVTQYADEVLGVRQRKYGNESLPFRPAVAVLAAMGAQALGISVDGVSETEQRMEILRGEDNRSIRWDIDF